jgi:hypothetical protein
MSATTAPGVVPSSLSARAFPVSDQMLVLHAGVLLVRLIVSLSGSWGQFGARACQDVAANAAD